AFAESEVQAGKARAPYWVATATLARQVMPKWTKPDARCRQGLREQVHRPVWVLGESRVCRPYQRSSAFQLPIRRPGGAVVQCYWETRRPASQARELPASDYRISETISVPSKPPALAERQLDEPVRVELMGCVKIRDTSQLVWRPRVDGKAANVQAAVDADAFRVRAKVDRLGVGIIEIELNTVSQPLAQDDLHRIVVCGAKVTPAPQGVKLAVEERV